MNKPKGTGNFHYKKATAIKDGKDMKAGVIRVLYNRQYYVGKDVSRAMEIFKESTAYLGKSPPKLIADFRVKKRRK